MCCSVLQCVAVCCSALNVDKACCNVLHDDEVCIKAFVAVCCRVLPCVTRR